MNSRDDLTGEASMDDKDVEEIMARFRAGVDRMAREPAEAARIRGLADKADLHLLSAPSYAAIQERRLRAAGLDPTALPGKTAVDSAEGEEDPAAALRATVEWDSPTTVDPPEDGPASATDSAISPL